MTLRRRRGNEVYGAPVSKIRDVGPETDTPSSASIFWALFLENTLLSNQVCPGVLQVLRDVEMLTLLPLFVPNLVTNVEIQDTA